MTGGPLRARVAHVGVHAALAMPLRSATGTLEVLSVYVPTAATPLMVTTLPIGEQFAVPATGAVQNAQVPAEARRLVLHLQMPWPTGR
jgi:hypothetical protein